jgi:fibronectin-binding autotransporter adhesin
MRLASSPRARVRRWPLLEPAVVSVVALLAFLAAAPRANAATLTWSSTGTSSAIGGTGTWDTTALRWTADGSTWSAWNNAGIDTAVFAGTAGTVALSAPITVGGLTFNTTGYTITGDTLTGNTLTLAGPSANVTLGTDVAATIGSTVSGTAALVKLGSGTLTLANSNTYTGGTIVNAGVFRLGSPFAIQKNTAITVAAGATFDYNGSGFFDDTRNYSFTISGSGVDGMGAITNSSVTCPP